MEFKKARFDEIPPPSLDSLVKMKTRSSNANKVNYYPTGLPLTRGRRIANQRRSQRLKERRRREERHQRHLAQGISSGELANLPNVKLTRDNRRNLRQNDCVICRGSFRNGQQLTLGLPCNHPCHRNCMERWLRTIPTCPLCRACQSCEVRKIRRTRSEREE